MEKSLIKILLTSILHVAAVVFSVAQSTDKAGRMEGSVTDEKGEPIGYVTVLLQQPLDSVLVAGAITDAIGKYTFESVTPGKYILTLRFVGYQKQSMPIELQGVGSGLTIAPIILKEDTQLLGEVVVHAQKSLIEQEGNKLILNVQNSVVATGGSAAEVLERVPGVTIDQNDQISLNGKIGVIIMIDGKITYLPPAELATLLRSMNANNVATVEVISNPSSRFDAAGNSGMINIKMKKNTLEGFNGTATVGAGYGRYGKANGNVNLNYRSKKWNHFFNYGYVFNKRFYYAESERGSVGNGETISFSEVINRVQELPSHTWQGGSEWQWNSHNSISVNTTGSYNERLTYNNTLIYARSPLASDPDSTYIIDNDQHYKWYNVSGSLGYKHIFSRKGNELMVDLDYSDYGFQMNDNFIIKEFNKENIFKNEYNIISDQPSSFHIYTGRADYIHRLNEKTSVEMGIKYSHVNTVNNILFTNNLTGQYETDPVRSNDFNYTEQIGAAYMNAKTKLLGFDAQLGLRAEQTEYRGFSVRTNKSIERNYLRVFPSVNLIRNITENYQLGLSYSYRIDRPAYNDLYPYVYFFSPYDSQLGNPTLLPQFTHNIQVSQTIAKDYTINMGYSSIAQYINFAILLKEDQVSVYATKKNFDTFQNYYLNLIAPIEITKNWMVNCNLNLFYNNFSTQLLGETYTSSCFSGTANISQTFTLPWGMTGEMTGVYKAPAVMGLLQNGAVGSVNAGLQKQLFDKRANLRINITDLFYTNNMRSSMTYPGFEMGFLVLNETRVVRLNFTYNIGKTPGKTSRRRNTLEEEQKRIGVN